MAKNVTKKLATKLASKVALDVTKKVGLKGKERKKLSKLASKAAFKAVRGGSPKKAKKLYFGVIPRAVDDYQTYIEKFAKEEGDAKLINPTWHVHGGHPPAPSGTPSFNLLLNLIKSF